MTTTTRLLLAYDGSDESARAIAAAARLLPEAEAVVVYARSESAAYEHAALARIALPDSVIAGSVEMYEREAEEVARRVADRGHEIAGGAGLEAIASVHAGPTPSRTICRAAAEHDSDLIVCGSRGRGGFAGAFLGSTSSSLLHHCPRPVLVVPPGAGDLSGPMLIGYDGSDGSRAAIATAARLLSGRTAVVVHAWPSPVRHSFAGEALLATPVEEVHDIAVDLDHIFAEHASELAEEGAAIARELELDARGVAIESATGAWRALVATARAEGASLIVAGCRGRGALASTILGSVASDLVHNAELPTLIVRGT
jgi:nucleotide-binding universal stress UspA family protein